MPLTLPTIQQGVYNRLTFLDSVAAANDQLIDDFTAENLVMFAPPLDIDLTNDDWLDLANYPPCVLSLMPDLVACQMLQRHIIFNQEGTSVAGTENSGRILSKAKAGEAETGWVVNASYDKTRVFMSSEKLIAKFIRLAEAKAKSCGLCLVFVDCVLQSVSITASTTPTLTVTDWPE